MVGISRVSSRKVSHTIQIADPKQGLHYCQLNGPQIPDTSLLHSSKVMKCVLSSILKQKHSNVDYNKEIETKKALKCFAYLCKRSVQPFELNHLI